MLNLQKVLIPTDFSESSLLATRYAVEMARKFSSELHMLHVIEDPLIYLPMFESQPLPSQQEFEQYAQTRLDSWLDPLGVDDLTVVRSWRHGTPFYEVIRHAQAENIDLIVVGTHGQGLAKHLLLGSTAEKIVRKARCPVLTVRPEGHQFVHPEATDPAE